MVGFKRDRWVIDTIIAQQYWQPGFSHRNVAKQFPADDGLIAQDFSDAVNRRGTQSPIFSRPIVEDNFFTFERHYAFPVDGTS